MEPTYSGNSARDKKQKFVELANKRVNKAIHDLKLIRNLSNRKNYDYTVDQSRKIIRALQQELDLMKQSFQDGQQEPEREFRL